MTGRRDPKLNEAIAGNYWGNNVPFVNVIWSELTKSGKPGLNLPQMRDYIGTGDSTQQKAGYKYTNGKKSIPLLMSKVLIRMQSMIGILQVKVCLTIF